MKSFVNFLLAKSYAGKTVRCPAGLIDTALKRSVADARYHARRLGSDASEAEVLDGIRKNQGGLAVFLYRLGSTVYQKQPKDGALLDAIAWAMKECCACEIYFSNRIDVGFTVVHGLGTVIGSRNTIGKGFTIYQGCTIGHRSGGEKGGTIGDHVTMYAHSFVYGDIAIGDGAVIGSNCLVLKDVPAGTKCHGPANMV